MHLPKSLLALALLLLFPWTAPAATRHFAAPEPLHYNVYAARFTPDSGRVVAADTAGVLIEWDFLHNRQLRRVQAPFDPANIGVALTEDAATAAFVAADGRVALYEVAGGKFRTIPLAVAEGCKVRDSALGEDGFPKPSRLEKECELGFIAIAADSKVVFVGDSSGRLYRSENGAPFALLTAAEKPKPNDRAGMVTALAVSPDGLTLAVGKIGKLQLLAAVDGRLLQSLAHDPISYAMTIAFSPDGKLVSAGAPGVLGLNHANQEVPVWEVGSGRKLQSFTMSDGMAFFGGFSRDGKQVLCASSSSAYIFDLATGQPVGAAICPTQKHDPRWRMDTSPDGKYLLISGADGLLQVYEIAKILTEKEPQPLAVLESRVSMVEALYFAPDNAALLVSYEHSRPQVLDLKEKKLRAQLDFHHEVREFIFPADHGKLLAAGPDAIGQWQWPGLTPLPEVKLGDEGRYANFLVAAAGGSGVYLANNVLKDEKAYDWMIPELALVDLQQGAITKKFLLRDLQDHISLDYQLACVDFAAATATVIDRHERDRAISRRRTPQAPPVRALVYSLADGKRLREILPESEATGRFACQPGQFQTPDPSRKPEWQPLHFHKELSSGRFQVLTDNGLVVVTDRETGQSRRLETFATNFTNWKISNQIERLALAADGSLLAIGTNKGDVGIYEVQTEKWLGTYLYLGYGEWIWSTDQGIVNASANGAELVEESKQ